MPARAEPIARFTPAGHDIIRTEPRIQALLTRFWDAPEPEVVVGGRFVGAGRYSTVSLVGGIAVKICSPTSSQDYFETGIRRAPEDLIAQFDFLGELHDHLNQHDGNITTPEQFFVMRSEHHGYLLGQEYMEGYQSFIDWANDTIPVEREDIYQETYTQIKQRIKDSVAGTELGHHMTDLRLDKDGMHGGNVLVPAGTMPGPDMPFCVIDQPGVRTPDFSE